MLDVMDGDVTVTVEVVLLSLVDGAVGSRACSMRLVRGAHPDDVARLCLDDADPAGVCHSTSWRWAPQGLVLTYAVLPDPWPAGRASPLVEPSIVTSGDARRPSLPVLHPAHVVAHAVRHLAQLGLSDAAFAASRSAAPALWAAIEASAAAMPVAPHAEAHAAARAAALAPLHPPSATPG